MTPQEREILTQFLQRLGEAHGVQKDAEADALIREAVSRQPDAAYLLVQKTLLTGQALQNAQAQIADLQRQPQETRGWTAGSGLLGSAASGGSPTPVMPSSAAPTAPPAPAPAARPGFFSGGAPSFLGTAAAAVAGTVAGGFLFQGIEGLLHPHNAYDGGNGNAFLGNEGLPREVTDTTTVNNYYGDATPPQDAGGFAQPAAFDDVSDSDFFSNDADSSFI